MFRYFRIAPLAFYLEPAVQRFDCLCSIQLLNTKTLCVTIRHCCPPHPKASRGGCPHTWGTVAPFHWLREPESRGTTMTACLTPHSPAQDPTSPRATVSGDFQGSRSPERWSRLSPWAHLSWKALLSPCGCPLSVLPRLRRVAPQPGVGSSGKLPGGSQRVMCANGTASQEPDPRVFERPLLSS